MAQNYGPNIITDGLILNLDAADINSYPGPTLVDVMVVGGGGGGGMDMGGGGGGGGVVYQQNYSVTPGAGIAVTVGAGGWGAPAGGGGYRGDGAGPQPNDHQFTIGATAGGNSVFGNITAYGGGYGASSYYGYTPNYGVGGNGGSGGGASGYTAGATVSGGTGTTGQGYRGGNSGGGAYYSGGGGGAGGAGADGPNQPNGGPGILIPEMSPFYFGGGGGGASYSLSTGGNGGIGGGGGGALGSTTGGAGINNGSPGGGGGPNQWAQTPGGNAGANTGGGGGGGSHYNRTNQGGNGGSGIVIVRYQGPPGATGGTITSRNGYTYHTFTSSGTFTPGGQAIWYDNSGNNRNSTLINGPGFSSSNGGVITFDGSNDYVDLGTNVYNLGIRRSATFSGWLLATTTGPAYLLSDWNGLGMTLRFNNSTSSDFYVYGSNRRITASYTFITNVWYHLAGVMDGANMYLYINGVLVGTAALGEDIGSSPSTLKIGCRGDTAAISAQKVGNAQIYNRTLSASEILQNYNLTKTRFGL